jgi:hypothetical protein
MLLNIKSTPYVFVIWNFSFRLEEKLSNVESENKVLRQQAVSMAPSKILSGRSKSNLQVSIAMFLLVHCEGSTDNLHLLLVLQRSSENVNVPANDLKTTPVS